MKIFFILLFCCANALFAQQTDNVDFKTAKAEIVFGDLTQKEVSGIISYEFEILKDVDSVFIDANNFDKIKYRLDGQFEDSLYNGKQLVIKLPFKASGKHKIDIVWETTPKKALYFIDWEYESGNKQIWTQGQGKYTSSWLPSFDDMNEKVEFDLTIIFYPEYQVIANGELKSKIRYPNLTEWHYDMQEPMSSYLVALVIGKYAKKVNYSKSGISLEMYYYPEDSLQV